MQTILARAALATLLAAAPAAAADSTLVRAGTVDIYQTRVAFLVSANGGGGVLHYRGHNYPFSIGGLGIGGIGVSKLEAIGTVYNMTAREQFSGAYSLVRTGYALGDSGSGKLWLKNGDGVVLELRGKSKGVGLSLGADVVNISFK
jgi:hypothetical protein